MKKHTITMMLFGLVFWAFNIQAQEETGLDGDHFSLEGALEVFKSSNSVEDFEKRINEEDIYVNNLDLNQDGEVDYIKVIDNVDENVHAIVLQVDINDSESQDVAVIEIEKTGQDNAIIQIIGDETLYGEEAYYEPFEEEASSDGRGGPSADYTFTRVVVNVWFWPSVQFIYGPRYHPWVSPWRWNHYPTYWKPWRAHPYAWHYSKRKSYHGHYHRAPVLRVHRAHKVYTPKRRTSKTVVKRRTTVVKKGKNNTVVKSRTTTKKKSVKNKNNKTNVKKSKTVKRSKRKGN